MSVNFEAKQPKVVYRYNTAAQKVNEQICQVCDDQGVLGQFPRTEGTISLRYYHGIL